MSVVLKVRPFKAEAHFRGLPANLKGVKQRHKMWISAVVIDDKTGIHSHRSFIHLDLVSMGMSAEIIIAFKYGNITSTRQIVSHGQSRYASTDDRYRFHLEHPLTLDSYARLIRSFDQPSAACFRFPHQMVETLILKINSKIK